MASELKQIEKYASASLPDRDLRHLEGLEATATARLPVLADDVVRPAYLAHFVLLTNQLEAMRRWWRLVLGAEATFASGQMEFLTFDQEHHRVAIFDRGALKSKGPEVDTAGLHHVAFAYASLADLVATYRRLKAAGVLPMRTINHGISLSNYYLDPDNNRVELQVDVFADRDALNAWLARREFNRNPIGVLFDFEELVRRFDAGEDPRALLAPEAFAIA